MKYIRQSWIQKLRRALGTKRGGMSSMSMLSTRGGIPIRQTKLAPDGLEFSEDVSEARWVEESLSDNGTLRSILPAGFPAYARIFHPAYLNEDEERPVRCSTVASWTGRTFHPLMQFQRIANLNEDPHVMYEDPPWGSHPRIGSIPERECRTLIEVLRSFTSTPGNCFFCLWEGYGNIDNRLYKASSRVRAPGRDYLVFRGPIDAIIAFLAGDGPFWRDSPNIWWPLAVLCEPQSGIKLAACQESGVRGDGSATKIQADSAVELELQRGVGAFTHWVPPARLRYPELDPIARPV